MSKNKTFQLNLNFDSNRICSISIEKNVNKIQVVTLILKLILKKNVQCIIIFTFTEKCNNLVYYTK